jgi:hypothetical protein
MKRGYFHPQMTVIPITWGGIIGGCGMYSIHASVHYREQAERARRLSTHHGEEIRERLLHLAQCYDEVADDLLAGARVRHPEFLRRADRDRVW